MLEELSVAYRNRWGNVEELLALQVEATHRLTMVIQRAATQAPGSKPRFKEGRHEPFHFPRPYERGRKASAKNVVSPGALALMMTGKAG